jgi:hypothetical protein
LYFETGAGDGFREPRFSKERRLDPQITIGLLTDQGHHQCDSIDAHLTIVLAALAVSRWTEHAPGRPIRKFVRTARRYRTIDPGPSPRHHRRRPLPRDLHEALGRSHRDPGAH